MFKREHKKGAQSPIKHRLRRGTGQALLGLQQFLEPSVEQIFEAQNVEQRDDEDTSGLGEDEESIGLSLAEALARSPVDTEEIRQQLTLAAQAGLDWRLIFDRAVAEELRACPYRAPSMPTAGRVAPRE